MVAIEFVGGMAEGGFLNIHRRNISISSSSGQSVHRVYSRGVCVLDTKGKCTAVLKGLKALSPGAPAYTLYVEFKDV